MSKFLAEPCACCGERGRDKEILRLTELRDGKHIVIDSAFFCHDEEKSCYYYYIMRAA